MLERSEEGDFTQDGLPNLKALTKVIGFAAVRDRNARKPIIRPCSASQTLSLPFSSGRQNLPSPSRRSVPPLTKFGG